MGRPASAVASLEWMRLRRSHRATLSLVAALLVTITVTVSMFRHSGGPKIAFEAGMGTGFFSFLNLLLAFLCSAQAIAEEVESRTVGYLLVRPASRSAIVLGKLVAGYGLAMSVLTLCFVVLAVASVPAVGGGESILLVIARTYGAVALHMLVACSMCLLAGSLLPEAAGVLAILYLGIFEFICSFAPFLFRLLSPAHHAIVVSGRELDGSVARTVPEVPAYASATALLSLAASALVLAMIVVATREYRYAKS